MRWFLFGATTCCSAGGHNPARSIQHPSGRFAASRCTAASASAAGARPHGGHAAAALEPEDGADGWFGDVPEADAWDPWTLGEAADDDGFDAPDAFAGGHPFAFF